MRTTPWRSAPGSHGRGASGAAVTRELGRWRWIVRNPTASSFSWAAVCVLGMAACGTGASSTQSVGGGGPDGQLPLVLVGDVDLPGAANRFDYQDIDAARGHLI